MTPFLNGTPNTYACGLRIKSWRGVRTVGHDGLWPGFKTTFVRVPDHNAAVICISNDATSDPHDLAFQVVDALIEGAPGVHAVPEMPDWAAQPALAGCYLLRAGGTTVEIGRDAKDRVTASVNGVTTYLVPTADGRLATSRGSGDFTLRFDITPMPIRQRHGSLPRPPPVPSYRLPARCFTRPGPGTSRRSAVTSFVSTRRSRCIVAGWIHGSCAMAPAASPACMSTVVG
jgi:hypothetical protein